MLFLYILIGIIVLTGLLLFSLTRVYTNRRQTHTTSPASLDIPFEEVYFPTKRGRRLCGWWVAGRGGKKEPAPVLILVHGWSRNMERLLPYIREFYARGFRMLAFDARNHGSSDRDGHSSMVKFAQDIRAAIDFAEERNKGQTPPIGVVGLSIGGAATLYASGLDPRIRSAVTVGAFAHPADLMRREFRRRHIPYYPFVWLLFRYMEWRIGLTFEEIAPINNIIRTAAPVLLVHGDKDRVVPVQDARRLKEAVPSDRVRLWIIAGRGHSDCHMESGFWKRMTGFFEETL